MLKIQPRPGQANDGLKGHLRTSVRCAIIAVIAHLLPAEIAPAIPPPEIHPMTATAGPDIIPGEAASLPELRAADQGVADALVAVLSDAGLRRSEAAALTWGDVQRWDNGSGRITVIRSKTDVEAQGAVVAITPPRHPGPGRHPAGGRWCG